MENEPRNKSPEEIKEEAIELGRTIGVQVLFEIDPNKSAGEIEKIYGQTLDFLKGLNPEQVNKLKNEKGDIYISGLDDLNSLVKEFNPHVSGNESVSNEQTVVPQETEDVIEEIESPSPNEKEPNIKKIDGVHVHLSRFVAQNPQITTEQKEDIWGEIDGALQDLEQDELKILQDRVTILIKDESVLYPVFDKNTLRVGLFATGEEILNAIRKTVIPLVNEEIKNKTDSMSEVEGSLKVGDKVFWEGSEKVILSIDDQWVEFVDGPIVSREQFAESFNHSEILKEQPNLVQEKDETQNPDINSHEQAPDNNTTGHQKIEGVDVYLTRFVAENPQVTKEQIEDVKIQIVESLKDLEENEKQLLKDRITILIKDSSVLYPVFDDKTNLFNVGIGTTKEEIINVVRTTVIPLIKQNYNLNDSVAEPVKQINQDVVNTTDNNVQNTEPQPTPEGIKPPEFDIEEIKNSDEWKELDDFRKMAVREEIRTKESNTLGLGIKWQDYENKKDLLENKIRESLKPKGTEVLSDEQQKELNKKINTIIFQSLVEEEHKNRLKNEREIKLETVGGKVLEAMKYATGSKAFKWYLNQNKWVRLGAMSSLATIVGIGAGSAVTSGALAYGGYRFARGVASFGASTATAATLQRVKSLSIDELNKKEKEEINNLESSDIPRIEKTEKYNEIKNRYEKLRLQKALIKTGATVAVGGLAGAGTGALQNFLYDVDPAMVNGGETPASIEASQNDVPKIPEQESDTQAGAQVETSKPPVAEPKSEGVESPEDNKQEGTEEKKPDEVKKLEDSKASVGSKEDNEKGDLLDTKSFKFIPAKGDSTWKLIEKSFSENPKFDEMTVDMTPDEMRASRSFVVSNYLREALKTPEKFGMGPNGEVYVGKEIDLTELFKDEDKLSQIIEKAKKLSPQQIQSINDNDAKILAWVQNPENQGIRLTNDKVSEILSMKPKSDMAKMFEPNSGEVPRSDVGGVVDPSQPERTSLEVENTEGSTKLEPEKNQEFPYTIEDTERVLEEVRNREPVSAEIDTKEEVGLEKQIEAKTAPNIEDYTDASQPERTGEVYRESIKATSDPAFEKYLDRAFVSGIDDVYGKSRFLGLGRIQGVDTKDWLLMKGLPANKVVEFYSGNSQEVDFPQNVAKELATSDSHAKFWKQMDVLMKASGGVVRPYQNENVAVFMRRLVGHTLKNVKTT